MTGSLYEQCACAVDGLVGADQRSLPDRKFPGRERVSRFFVRTPAAAAAVIVLAASGGCGGAAGDADSATSACERLAGVTVGGVTVRTAVGVAAAADVPAHCRVAATIAPRLNFEVRLPAAWNGKLYYGGGGGYDGSIPSLTGSLLSALQRGYATVASDSGHQGDGYDASFALNDPQAAELFGSTSVPTVMPVAKQIVQTVYGSAPSRSYFEGCSNGGREGLMAVQRNPGLFDGVIAGAPAYNWTGLQGAFNRNVRALAAPGAQFSAAKILFLAAAVRNACDALDGIVDGIVSNQAACNATVQTSLSSLRCPQGADTGPACLSDAQLNVLNLWTTPAMFGAGPIYRSAGWNLTGNEDDPGAWATALTGNGDLTQALQFRFQDTTIKNYLARSAAADSLAYTPYDRDVNALNAMAALNDATDADLRPFSRTGAKLILWHGGNDALVSVGSTSEYRNAVVAAVGGQAAADAFLRYYVLPGVDHCGGGPGADGVDFLGALDAWVDKGNAPDVLTARKTGGDGTLLFSRPACRYPAYPYYVGASGDAAAAKLAASYACVAP